MVLEDRLLPYWEGSDEPSDGRIVEAEHRWGLEIATDYDRACDCSEWIGCISVKDGAALVLGGDDAAATWRPLKNLSEGILVRWIYADSEDEILEAALELTNSRVADEYIEFDINSSPLVLFAATEIGNDPIYPRLNFSLAVGRYGIFTSHRDDNQMGIICHTM